MTMIVMMVMVMLIDVFSIFLDHGRRPVAETAHNNNSTSLRHRNCVCNRTSRPNCNTATSQQHRSSITGHHSIIPTSVQHHRTRRGPSQQHPEEHAQITPSQQHRSTIDDGEDQRSSIRRKTECTIGAPPKLHLQEDEVYHRSSTTTSQEVRRGPRRRTCRSGGSTIQRKAPLPLQ